MVVGLVADIYERKRERDRGVPVDGNLVAVQESEHNTKEGGGDEQ